MFFCFDNHFNQFGIISDLWYHKNMGNEIKYLPFEVVFNGLVELAKENNFNNVESIKWIMVKVLRLKRDQFDDIIQVDEPSFDNMKKALIKHINGETLGKIFGFIEFYGNFFNVTDNVFDPRLSTEALVDAVLNCDNVKMDNCQIVDLCTGSGCVAITLSKQLNKMVNGVDISPFALEIAKENNAKINAQANFFQMDLNNDWQMYFNNKYDVIVSNPPYWNSAKILANAEVVNSNPLIGFDGGEDGLHYIRRIIEMSPMFLNDNGLLFLEIEPDQENNIRQFLKDNFCDIKTYLDHRNITRVISARLK